MIVSFIGGVINYSELLIYLEFIEFNGFWGIVLGVYFKYVGEFIEERFLYLKIMLVFLSVVGLGEIGLDWIVFLNFWRK